MTEQEKTEKLAIRKKSLELALEACHIGGVLIDTKQLVSEAKVIEEYLKD